VSLVWSVQVALRALRANALRSALTVLGMVIGVAAVIVMVAMSSGARALVTEQVGSLGANLLLILPASGVSGGALLGAGTRPTLTEDDAWAMARDLPALEAAVPAVIGSGQVVRGARNWATAIVGSTPEYLVARDWQLVAGRVFGSGEARAAAKLAVLGATAAEKLFGEADALGGTVRIERVPFTVIGLLAPKGQSVQGDDQDDIVLVPLATAKRRLTGGGHEVDRRTVDYILAKVRAPELMADAERQVRALLRQRHRLREGAPDDFTVENLDDLVATADQVGRALGLLLGAVASISLVVGGISIMNIMLVSVTERTREIGLRLALGARARDIRNQFLMEAVVLGALGGMVGIALGVAVSIAIAGLAGWPALVSLSAILLAFGFAAGVGLIFGLVPALRAARLQPVEALRVE